MFDLLLGLGFALLFLGGVTTPQPNDLVFGLWQASGPDSLELVRGSATPGGGAAESDFWDLAGWIQSVEFDNLNGVPHNASGNLLGLDFGTAGASGSIWSFATTIPEPAGQLIGNTIGLGGGGLTQSRLCGLSVSPDNSKLAVCAFDSARVIVFDYSAGDSTGFGASLSGGRQSAAVLCTSNDTQGTTWLDDETLLAFSSTGEVHRIDANSMATMLAATIDLGIVEPCGIGFTDIEYQPDVSPFVYAMYGGFDGPITTNRLTVLQPSGFALDLVATADYSESMASSREIALDRDGNLFVAQFDSAIDFIPNVADIAAIADNSSIDWYTSPVVAGFSGIDIAHEVVVCDAAVPNRRLQDFDIRTREGELGHFDLIATWILEASTPLSDFGTTVEFELDGLIVGSVDVSAVVAGDLCCSLETAGTCGVWLIDAVPTTGECQLSPQGEWLCTYTVTTSLLDVAIDVGEPVTARLVAAPSAIPDVLFDDNELTRLAPFFNRRLRRVAWLPDPELPGRAIAHAFLEVSAEPVDAAVDFSEVVAVHVPPDQTEFKPNTDTNPAGINACALGSGCGDACGEGKRCYDTEPHDQSATCLGCGVIIELTVGSFELPPGPAPYEAFVSADIDALPEAIVDDDTIDAVIDGYDGVPNRTLLVGGCSIAASAIPGLVDIELAWHAENGGSQEPLATRFALEVDGEDLGLVFDSEWIVSADASGCTSPCGAAACGEWQVGETTAVSSCAFSELQGICVCGIELVQSLPAIPAQPGDVVTIVAMPAAGSMPETFTGDDAIAFVVPQSFIRGDANGDGNLDIGDATTILAGIFQGGLLSCRDAADADDDGSLTIADAIVVLVHLFEGTMSPSPPFPNCGFDASLDSLDCEASAACP